MNIPESSIEPFGYDIPKIVMVRQGYDPALLASIFRECDLAYKDTVNRWRIIHRCLQLGIVSPMKIDEVGPRLRVLFAGGKDVECNIRETDDGFQMSITFYVPGDDCHYGSYTQYPDEG